MIPLLIGVVLDILQKTLLRKLSEHFFLLHNFDEVGTDKEHGKKKKKKIPLRFINGNFLENI